MTPRLLDDTGMRGFIASGYTVVQTSLPAAFHARVYECLQQVFDTEGNPGNNLLPRLPALQKVFDDSAVHGALLSILGPGYYLHPHRHCHFNPPGSQGQRLHKDSWTRRHHRTRWAMAFYYPQDTPVELGPTGVVPGSQYLNAAPTSDLYPEIPLTGPAGTVVLVHYDLWHRATPNASDQRRYMAKFLFARMEEPGAPSWNAATATWPEDKDPRQPMWQSLWDWYSGRRRRPRVNGKDAALLTTLRTEHESAGLQAAYALGTGAVPALVEMLGDESEAARRNAGYALTAIGAPAVPALVEAAADARATMRASAADVLGDLGRDARSAVPVLIRALEDHSELVRRNAAQALGLVDTAAHSAAPALTGVLHDADEWVRRNAALALARLGPAAAAAVPDLVRSLEDDNRYVRAKAAHALRRVNTPQAQEALLDFLLSARWCPITNAKSTY